MVKGIFFGSLGLTKNVWNQARELNELAYFTVFWSDQLPKLGDLRGDMAKEAASSSKR
ncbi:hypothetical protein [Paenibacillus jiagnxiensis]|uniref:hypothetical protein n=1 Tax=Paenibacillus jiagnxiensis TaxID=3228926 RepID=UPI0038D4C17D